MSTLTTFRTAVLRELRDPSSTVFSSDDADRAIARAVEEYSRANPIEATTTKATTAASRDVTLDGTNFPSLIEATAVEYLTGQWPPAFRPFSVWGTTLTIDISTAPDGSNCKVYWHKAHTVDVSGSTIPSYHEAMIVKGTAGYAMLAWAAYAANRLNTDPRAVEQYDALGRAAVAAFQADLKALSRKLRTAELYTTYQQKQSQLTDAGP